MTKLLVKTDKNGTKYFQEDCKCWKCGGSGIYEWGAVINGHCQYSGVCYSCGGSGVVTVKTKEYTPEHEAKLQAQSEKREAKREAERQQAEVARIAKNAEREKAAAERQAQIDAENAKSNFVGSVGDKVDLVVTLAFETSFEVPSFRGYGTAEMTVYGFKDEAGNIFVWKTGSVLSVEKQVKGHIEFDYAHKGDKIHIKGSIKDHSDYKGTKQTVLTRTKLIEIIERTEVA